MTQTWIVCFPVNLLTNPVCEPLWFTLIFSNPTTAVLGTLLYKKSTWSLELFLPCWTIVGAVFPWVQCQVFEIKTKVILMCTYNTPGSHSRTHTHTLDVLNFLQPMKNWTIAVENLEHDCPHMIGTLRPNLMFQITFWGFFLFYFYRFTQVVSSEAVEVSVKRLSLQMLIKKKVL